MDRGQQLRDCGWAARLTHCAWDFPMDVSPEDEHQRLVRAGDDLDATINNCTTDQTIWKLTAHRDKLRQHIADLQAHIKRLRNRDR